MCKPTLYIPAKRLSANRSSRELLPTPAMCEVEGRGVGSRYIEGGEERERDYD